MLSGALSGCPLLLRLPDPVHLQAAHSPIALAAESAAFRRNNLAPGIQVERALLEIRFGS